MSASQFKICLVNPIEVFQDSPRNQKFLRALKDMNGIELHSIGVGPGFDDDKNHLDIAKNSSLKSVWKLAVRYQRLLFFTIFSLLRIHWMTQFLHSPSRHMNCNFLIRKRIKTYLHQEKPDLVIARDIYSIPLLRGLVLKQAMWIDLPDLTAEVTTYKPFLRFLLGPYFRYLTKCLPKTADTFTTVSNSLAIHFCNSVGLNSKVVHNSLPQQYYPNIEIAESPPKTTYLDPPIFRFVYVGAAIRRRGIELCILAFRLLPKNYSLDLYLIPTDPIYLNEISCLLKNDVRIKLQNAVIPSDVVPTISRYSAALVIIPTNSLNSKYALPNKFFQALQARLPIITGPTPEVVDLVRTFDIGEIAQSFSPEHIAFACQQLNLPRIIKIRKNLEFAARTLDETKTLEEIRQRAMSILLKT